MKGFLKRIILVIAAVMLSVLTASAVYAVPEDTQGDEALIPTPIAAADASPEVTEDTANNSQNERGGNMSVGGVLLVGVLVVIINTVISFAVANRFYKLTKKDSHIQSEIRALRRDINDKFAGNIKQIKEKEVKVKNSNPNYAGSDVIKAQKPASKQPEDKELEEFAKRWNIEIEREEEPELKEKALRTSRSYTPERKKTVSAENSDDVKEYKKKSKSKNMAKKFIGEIFPLDEDN